MHDFSDGIFRQQGAVLLLLVLVLLTGSTFTLLVKLNSDTNFYIRHNNQTQKSLRLAKQALIGYAINFPEIDNKPGETDPIEGPGYFLCPDINNDGGAGGSCSFLGKTTIGRLPYKTLEVAELTDSSGARLWYALSDNFRNNPALEPLNSETEGQLRVDGRADIVAVVIAPGAPVGDQVRDPGETDIEIEIGNYLESDNNDLDLDFISADPANPAAFNDSLIIITRRELMQIIEKRVLSEVEDQLKNYRETYGAFPWLSPFDNPNTSAFKSSAGNYEGHIPFHYWEGGDSPPDTFTDDITLSWDIRGATLNEIPDSDAPLLPLPMVTKMNDIYIPAASCTWTDRETFDCMGSSTASTPTAVFPGMKGKLDRTYDFDITFRHNVGAGPVINDPTSSSPRTRDLEIRNGALAASTVTITVTDRLTDIFYDVDHPGAPSSKQASVSLRSDEDTTGTIIARDILYDLDVNGIDGNGDGDFLDAGTDFAPELHGCFVNNDLDGCFVKNDLIGWFIRNEWYKHVYIAYSSSEPLPGDTGAGSDCKARGGCLELKGIADEDIRAIAVIAGAPLAGKDRDRPSADISDYFELENKSQVADQFEKAAISGSFNDQVRIIERAEPPPP